MSRSFRGHNVAYQCKGLDLSNYMYEYEVNRLTNEKVLKENETLTQMTPPARTPTQTPGFTNL